MCLTSVFIWGSLVELEVTIQNSCTTYASAMNLKARRFCSMEQARGDVKKEDTRTTLPGRWMKTRYGALGKQN